MLNNISLWHISLPLAAQLLSLLASIMLLLAFAMLAQRRLPPLIQLFAMQGCVLSLSTALVAYSSHLPHLYFSAALTLVLKGLLLPWVLSQLVHRLKVRFEVESLIAVPTTMLVGIMLVIIAFVLTTPIAKFSVSINKGTLGIALACVMLALLMMITRTKAIPQVIAFLAIENGVFLAATNATQGMPMVVELGIALDVLVGAVILGVFFFQINERFDSLDIHHMEQLKER